MYITLQELKAIKRHSGFDFSKQFRVVNGCIAFFFNHDKKDLIKLGIAFVKVLGEEKAEKLAQECAWADPGQVGQWLYFRHWFCADPKG